MTHWLDLDANALQTLLQSLNQPAYRAKQLEEWLHLKRADAWPDMKNLPAELKTALGQIGPLRSLHELERRSAADHLTHKWLFEAQPETAPNATAKSHCLEAVLIIEKHHARRTACLSSMIGCPLNCAFCATGKLGFTRSLSAGEILEQAYRLDAWSRQQQHVGLSHIVFMGMGEPLLNLPAVLAAARRLNNPVGLGLSGRHLTISTVGIPDGIRTLSDSGVVHRLAVSLHAPNQKIRERLMPAAKQWPLAELLPALEKYAETSARDLTFE